MNNCTISDLKLKCTKIKELEALKIRKNKRLLLKKLKAAKACLYNNIKMDFKNCVFDFKEASLIGTNYTLQWFLRINPHKPETYHNQQTTEGIILLRHNK